MSTSAGEPRCTRREAIARAGALALGAGALGRAASAAAATRIAPRPTSAPPPNVLVIMVDEMRAPRWFPPPAQLARLLPNIASLRRGAVSFDSHFTVANNCTPSRAALVTGLYTHQTACLVTGRSQLDPGFPTWGTLLRELGYQTTWWGKWHLSHATSTLEPWGFAGGTFPQPNGGPWQGLRADPHIAAQFEHWLEQAGDAQPWCTTVSFVNPHDIAWWWRWSSRFPTEASAPSVVSALPPNFETPTELVERGKPRVQRSLVDTSDVSFGSVAYDGPAIAETWLPFLDLYVKLQLAVDGHVATVLDALARQPRLMENTVVVFTSDHGEYGASHGLRGKGAGVYDEAIRVPLIVTDFSRRLGITPGLRDQLTSSVDLAPLLLTLGHGSGEWRSDPRYAQIAARADLLSIARDPGAPGRDYVLHATDEVVTEFALLPYAASAPLHITALITPTHKFATYSHWRHGTLDPIVESQELELYDHTTAEGRLEVSNQTGRSPHEETLKSTLRDAIRHELRAALPGPLADAQHSGLAEYHALAAHEHASSEVNRMNQVEQIVRQFESRLP